MPRKPSSLPPSASLVVSAADAPLSKEQKAFNYLLGKLDRARRKLAGWREGLEVFQRRCALELAPLEQREAELQAELARSLDAAHGQKGVTAAEQRKLSAMIVDLAAAVLETRDDDEMKALYNRHGEADYDAEEAAADAQMKAMLERIFGVELGDGVDMSSPEAVVAHMEAQMRRRAEADGEAEGEGGADAFGDPPPQRPSPRQQAREARLAADEKAMSQTVREVYRKLASALHPDREPDPAERQRKTALMQRVNEAYQANNLLQLLELQVEIEQIDSAHLAGLAPERLKHYMKILRAQLKDLESEIFGIEHGLRERHRLRGRITPKYMLECVDADVAALGQGVQRLEGELVMAADLKALKAWLKGIRPARRQETWGGFPF